MDIKEIINRRTDLSTFVVHLTRKGPSQTAKQQLVSILTGAIPTIEARSAFGFAKTKAEDKGLDSPEAKSQRCVCFTETPLEHLHLLVQEIEKRQFVFEPYGIAVTKKVARREGVNPVWYIDQTPGHTWLSNPVNDLVDQAFVAGSFDKSPIAKIAPFFESMGTWPGGRKEFWWEREWRHVGDFRLLLTVPFIGLCPEEDMPEFMALTEKWAPRAPRWLDPRWGLEQIIARLAGFDRDDIEVL